MIRFMALNMLISSLAPTAEEAPHCLSANMVVIHPGLLYSQLWKMLRSLREMQTLCSSMVTVFVMMLICEYLRAELLSVCVYSESMELE